MESPAQQRTRHALIFYSAADLLHSLDVDIQLHFQPIQVDGLEELVV